MDEFLFDPDEFQVPEVPGGLKKCRIVAVLHAIVHNVFRAVTLRAAAAAAATSLTNQGK